MHKNKINVIYSWLLSYVSMLIIPIIVILISHMLSVSVIEEEINKAHTASLQQLNQVMENAFNDVYKIAIEVALNDNNLSIMKYSGEELTSDQKYNISLFINYLRILKLANGNVDEICIYYKNNNRILTNNGMYEAKDYYDFYIKESGMSYEDWIYQLTLPQQNYYTSISGISGTKTTNKDKDRIAYIQPLPFDIYSNTSATLMIVLNKLTLYDWLNHLDWMEEGYIYVIDEKNNIITSTNENSLTSPPILYENLKGSGKTYQVNINKEKVIVSYIKSNATGWKYAVIIPMRVYLKKVRLVRNAMIYSTFICILASAVLAWFFTKKNYKPLRKIISTIYQNHNKVPKYGHNDEWYLINNTIKYYINENQSLQEKLSDQIPTIKNYFLMQLLSGDMEDSTEMKTMVDFLQLDINYDCFAVILISINNFRNLINAGLELNNEIIKIAIENITEEFFNKVGRGYAVDMGKDKIAIITALPEGSIQDNYNTLKNVTQDIYSFLKENFNLGITAAISNIYYEFIELSKAYSEAQNALDYKIIKGEDSIIFFNELHNNVSSYNYSFKVETETIRLLRLGDFDNIKKILDDMISNLKNQPISLEFAKCVYFEIINTAIKSLNELEININVDEYLPIILSKKTFDEVYNEVCNLYYEMCEVVKSSKQVKNERLKNEIISYLDNNYADKQLSLEMLAKEFKVSVSYMSHFFNEQIGYNFIDYVHYLRLLKAKEFLAYSDMNISEVAKTTGYNSVYNFTRVFKRYENITPTEYRLSMVNASKPYTNANIN